MSTFIKHILLCWFIMTNLFVAGQNDVCVVEDGQLVFYLNPNWSEEKKREVSQQFGLDSLLIEEVIHQEFPGDFEFQNEWWKVKWINKNKVRISKSLEQLNGQLNWKKDHIISLHPPESEWYSGPGVVDMDLVSHGVNKLTKPVIIQFNSGKTKFILPGYQNANEVFISGSFNNWSTSELPLNRTAGGWETDIELPPGKYLYKYIVDGHWIKAPGNSLSELDGWGGRNSVFYRYNYTFSLEDFEDAKKIYLAASFNNWSENDLKLTKSNNKWILPLYLNDGTHAYKFIVDKEWITDPKNPVIRPDGEGNFNSFMSIGDTTIFKLDGYLYAKEVRLAGTFNGWNPAELLMNKMENGWELPYVLAKGNYEYKFIVDGEWMTDPENSLKIYHPETENSFYTVHANHTFVLEGHMDAKEVIVTGNFTGWSESNNRMIRENGSWKFPIRLKPGKYHYKFLVDDTWIVDPSNPIYEENEFGTGNSVLWIESAGILPE